MERLFKIINILNALGFIVALAFIHEKFDTHRVPIDPTQMSMPGDMAIGIGLFMPISFFLTWGMALIFKMERNLQNYCTVFATVFGLLTACYFLWTL